MATLETNSAQEKKRLSQRALEEMHAVRREALKQIATLATSGFGLVAALAWNEVIKAVIDAYVKPYVTVGAGILSQLIYATIVTLLAVFITLQLTRIAETIPPKKPPQGPEN